MSRNRIFYLRHDKAQFLFVDSGYATHKTQFTRNSELIISYTQFTIDPFAQTLCHLLTRTF
jgi:hypothetical protein